MSAPHPGYVEVKRDRQGRLYLRWTSGLGEGLAIRVHEDGRVHLDSPTEQYALTGLFTGATGTGVALEVPSRANDP